jgi:hypothetical protein
MAAGRRSRDSDCWRDSGVRIALHAHRYIFDGPARMLSASCGGRASRHAIACGGFCRPPIRPRPGFLPAVLPVIAPARFGKEGQPPSSSDRPCPLDATPQQPTRAARSAGALISGPFLARSVPSRLRAPSISLDTSATVSNHHCLSDVALVLIDLIRQTTPNGRTSAPSANSLLSAATSSSGTSMHMCAATKPQNTVGVLVWKARHGILQPSQHRSRLASRSLAHLRSLFPGPTCLTPQKSSVAGPTLVNPCCLVRNWTLSTDRLYCPRRTTCHSACQRWAACRRNLGWHMPRPLRFLRRPPVRPRHGLRLSRDTVQSHHVLQYAIHNLERLCLVVQYRRHLVNAGNPAPAAVTPCTPLRGYRHSGDGHLVSSSSRLVRSCRFGQLTRRAAHADFSRPRHRAICRVLRERT